MSPPIIGSLVTRVTCLPGPDPSRGLILLKTAEMRSSLFSLSLFLLAQRSNSLPQLSQFSTLQNRFEGFDFTQLVSDLKDQVRPKVDEVRGILRDHVKLTNTMTTFRSFGTYQTRSGRESRMLWMTLEIGSVFANHELYLADYDITGQASCRVCGGGHQVWRATC